MNININIPVSIHRNVVLRDNAQLVLAADTAPHQAAPPVAAARAPLPTNRKFLRRPLRALRHLASLAILLAADGPTLLEWLDF
jgi:hypothetical protein